MYRKIMAAYGRELDGCKVLAFSFEKESGPELYHYQLLNFRPKYFFFDCFGKMAQVIIPKDTEAEQMCIELAEESGGKKTLAILD